MINNLLSDHVINAISWMLLHSLWQGLIAALLASLVILLTRNTKAATRYNLLLAVFALQLLAAAVTFTTILNRGVTNAVATTVEEVPAVQPQVQETSGAVAGFQAGLAERMYNYFNENAPLIVGIWLFVILVMLVKMMADLAYMQKLRSQKVFQPADAWNEMVQNLSKELNISKPVTLLESALAKSPVVIGFFKPVILMPLSLLSNFSPEQVEAILRHELAHIRRNDYIVNMIQSVAEIIFFFNPSVWWISSLIRDEREHCCDELAVNGNMNKRVFVEALLSFQEYQLAGRFAQGFASRRYKTLHRVQRIFKINNQTAYPMTKIILTTCVVISVAALSAYADFRQQQQGPRKQGTMTQNEQVQTFATDTIPAELNSFNITRNGKAYKIISNNDAITYYIDGKKVSSQEMNAADKEAFAILESLAERGRSLNVNTKELENLRSALEERKNELETVGASLEGTRKGLETAQTNSNNITTQIIDDLLKDKIVTDSQAKFSIAAGKMTVNGKQQPADVHQRYKTKYLKDASITLSNE